MNKKQGISIVLVSFLLGGCTVAPKPSAEKAPAAVPAAGKTSRTEKPATPAKPVISDAEMQYVKALREPDKKKRNELFKAARKALMENLSGHAAFRTKEEEEKWKARQKEKRDELKAAKAGA